MAKTPSLMDAAILAQAALIDCIVPKGMETQVADAMRALRQAIDAEHLRQLSAANDDESGEPIDLARARTSPFPKELTLKPAKRHLSLIVSTRIEPNG